MCICELVYVHFRLTCGVFTFLSLAKIGIMGKAVTNHPGAVRLNATASGSKRGPGTGTRNCKTIAGNGETVSQMLTFPLRVRFFASCYFLFAFVYCLKA